MDPWLSFLLGIPTGILSASLAFAMRRLARGLRSTSDYEPDECFCGWTNKAPDDVARRPLFLKCTFWAHLALRHPRIMLLGFRFDPRKYWMEAWKCGERVEGVISVLEDGVGLSRYNRDDVVLWDAKGRRLPGVSHIKRNRRLKHRRLWRR